MDAANAVPPEGSTCPRHPGAPAVGTCARCGSFLCAADLRLLGARTYCDTCAVRPDVDYLEAFRLQHWGKRDGWAWLFGLGGVFNLALGAALAVGAMGDPAAGNAEFGSTLLLAVVSALSGVNGVLFWLGVRLARYGLLVGVLLLGAVQVSIAGPPGALGMFIPLVVALNVLFSWRSKLFFKLEVPRATLQRAWDLLHNNTLARQSTIAGVVGLAFPPFALAALVMGVVGLRRVNPQAWPPIGKKGYALAGIVLGAVALVGWAVVAVFWLQEN